ncbi:MAG: hypothetical protein JXB39_04220 [Deltaproteobacteria bacterium]|nr:hypothetical protein [Deltaproteobacteria bacterium]
MVRFLLPLLLVALLAPTRAMAAYLFEVPQVVMEVEILPDASARIEYAITFRNTPAGDPIDIVDVGMPDAGYDLSTMEATIDGAAAGPIRPSTYLSPGVEVPLSQGAVRPGETGVFRLVFVHPDLVFSDTTRTGFASFQITPTWFKDAFVVGPTDLRIAVTLPGGVADDEILYQDAPFQARAVRDDGRQVVGWQYAATRFTHAHRVGVSFPARTMERVVQVTRLELLLRAFEASMGARLLLGAALMGLWSWLFLRFSGATGWVLWLLGCGGVAVLCVLCPPGHLVALGVAVVLVPIQEWRLRARKKSYLPPILEIEGGGVQRGLTAPEAAVILEEPLAKVLSLVLVGLLKKGLALVAERNPLFLAVAEPYRGLRSKGRREAAAGAGFVMHDYENGFLDIIEGGSGLPLDTLDFSPALAHLVERTVDRMKGFDLSDTRDHYRSIVERAWEAVSALGDVQLRERALETHAEWVLLSSEPDTAFTAPGWRWQPRWMPVPVGQVGSPPPAAPATPVPSSGRPAPTVGDVAASFAGWAEHLAGQAATALLPVQVTGAPGGGLVDLGAVDRVSGDIVEALAESRSGGGSSGGSSSCACACAGCACACACAGGGR